MFLWLNMSPCHIYLCAILLKDIKNLNLLDLFTLVPAVQCVLCIKVSNLLKVWHRRHSICNTHRTHRPQQTNTHIQIYMNTTSAHNSYPVRYWITCWNENLLYWSPNCLSFSKITHLQKSYIWFHWRRQGFSCETQNSNWNTINEQSTCTTHRERMITLERGSYCYLVITLF